MESLADSLRRELQKYPSIRLAYLFGSAARGDARPDSDVDVAVWAGAPIKHRQASALTDDLGRSVGREVDLVDIATAAPLVLREVVSEGRVIMCTDEDERAELELAILARYLDTQHLRDVQYQALRDRVEEQRGRQA